MGPSPVQAVSGRTLRSLSLATGGPDGALDTDLWISGIKPPGVHSGPCMLLSPGLGLPCPQGSESIGVIHRSGLGARAAPRAADDGRRVRTARLDDGHTAHAMWRGVVSPS